MKKQRGGTIIGFILGVMVGLGAALAVAVYVTKVPVPFLNKGQSRSADQDVVEARKNKDWDPNAPLYGKNPVKPVAPAPAATAAPVVAGPVGTVAPPPAAAPAAPKPAPGGRLSSADPLGDLANARAATQPVTTAAVNPNAVNVPAVEPFEYLVQAGAFRTAEDAETQRAKLAIMGWEAKVSERDQAGRPVYRVRVGPFTRKDDADRLKEKLDAAQVEATLVRVQR